MFIPVMKKIRSMAGLLLLLTLFLGVTAESSAWASPAVDSLSIAVCEQQPSSPDEGGNAPAHFDEERESERDNGGEEGVITRSGESAGYIVRKPSAIALSDLTESLSATVFKVPII